MSGIPKRNLYLNPAGKLDLRTWSHSKKSVRLSDLDTIIRT